MDTVSPLRFIVKTCVWIGSFVVLCLLTLMIHAVTKFDGTAEFPVDCALVFGAAVHGKDDPGPGIARRVLTAVELYERRMVSVLIMSGGKGDDFQESEANVMRDLAVEAGVLSQDVLLEPLATSTFENIRFSRPIADAQGCSSIVGISDRYHLARILWIARHEGWDTFQVYPTIQHASRAFEVRSLVREALAFVYGLFFQLTL